jgi:GTP cyclohydrolase IA
VRFPRSTQALAAPVPIATADRPHPKSQLRVGGGRSEATCKAPSIRQGGNDVIREIAQTSHLMAVPRSGLGNEALGHGLGANERLSMLEAAEGKIKELFDVLRIDYANDHNTRDTPRRMARMLIEETLHGRYCPEPAITEFENVSNYDQLIVTGPIDLRSTCAHHFMPIYGHAYIGILPSREGKIIGLSKYDRIVQFFAARLQIQEELVSQIGQYLMAKTAPRGVAVKISAVHMCKTHRGVRSSHASRMVSSAFHGELATVPERKLEFLQECAALEQRRT